MILKVLFVVSFVINEEFYQFLFSIGDLYLHHLFIYHFDQYNMSFVNCRELAPGTVSLTGDWVHGDDSKQNLYYTSVIPGLNSV